MKQKIVQIARRGLPGALFVLMAASAQAQSAKIVAHAATDVGELSSAAAARIFLKQELKFASGARAVPVDLAKTSPVRAAFSKEVLGKAVSAVEQFWIQQVFAGKETPPVSKATDAEVLDFVKATPGAIGYVAASAELPSGVKVITLK
jgi:ABC-type phosphate transport system substrate-binding protein